MFTVKQSTDLRESALVALDHNTRRTRDATGQLHTYAVPSPTTYPFQWTGWDSQFHAIVFAKLGRPTRAQAEIRSILSTQHTDGFIPHVTFWDQGRVSRSPFNWHVLESRGKTSILPWKSKPKSTAATHPPVLAEAVDAVFRSTEDVVYVQEHLPAVYRYYRWLAENRDPDRDGLISVISQFETGLDYSPAYDPVIGYRTNQSLHRLEFLARRKTYLNKWLFDYNLEHIFRFLPFHTEDVLVNAIYIRNLDILANLADVARETYDDPFASIAAWARNTASKALQSLLTKSYDEEEGIFWNLAGPDEQPMRIRTISSLMPLIIPNLPSSIAHQLIQKLTDPEDFWTPYPVPSVSRRESAFSPDNCGGLKKAEQLHRYIWRGALSMNTNWYLCAGLRAHGRADIADEISRNSRELVRREGFNEFYNPLTGSACGASDFGWATLAAVL